MADMHKSRPIGPPMIIVIVVLYLTTCANLSLDWLIVRTALVTNGQNLLTIFTNFSNPLRWITVVTGVFGVVCTILVDATMVSTICQLARFFFRLTVPIDLAMLVGLGTTLANRPSPCAVYGCCCRYSDFSLPLSSPFTYITYSLKNLRNMPTVLRVTKLLSVSSDLRLHDSGYDAVVHLTYDLPGFDCCTRRGGRGSVSTCP